MRYVRLLRAIFIYVPFPGEPRNRQSESDMAPQTLSRFEIIAELGRSDLVAVYQARDLLHGRTVVLRAMRTDAPAPQCAVRLARFREDAARVAVLESPNIAQLHEISEADGFFYLVLEFVNGQSLRELLDRRETFSVSDLIDVSRQVCTAFDHAHAHQVLASNIKPSNIMVESDGNVKLLGYGLNESTSETREVLHYLSPEQVRGERLDARSNLFSWGTVLYEMATGRRAFEGEDVDSIRKALLEEIPPPGHEVNPDLPAGISHVIAKAIAKSPLDRYGSGAELVRELENYKTFRCQPAVLPFVVTPPARPMPASPSPAPEPMKPSPRVAAAAFTAARAAALQNDLQPAFVAEPQDTGAANPAAPRQRRNGIDGAVPSPAPQTAAAASGNTPGLAAPLSAAMQAMRKAGKFAISQQTRMLVYAMLAVVVALVALVVFGAVYLHNSSGQAAASAPSPLPANDPAFSEPTLPTAEPSDTVQTVTLLVDTPEPAVRHSRRTTPMPAKATLPAGGELAIQTVPPGAQVQVDGRGDVTWTTPCLLGGVPAGQHTLTITKAGYTTVSRTVQVYSGNRAQMAVSLAKLAAVVIVTSNPAGAAVYLDGHDTGRVTPAQLVADEGSHNLTVQKSGYLQAATTTQLTAAQTFHFDPELKAAGNVEDIRTTGKFTKLFGKGSPEGMGRVLVRTSPKGAWIMLNNQVIDRSTPADFFLPPGNYNLKLSLAGYRPLERVVTVERGSKVVLNETLQP